jgi:CRP-like cAMP-binding protein
MSSQKNEPRAKGNALLTALSALSQSRIEEQCEPVKLERDSILFQPDDDIEFVHFPTAGCLSLLRVMNDGNVAEIGTVGFEGMSTVAAIHFVNSLPVRCIVQIEGDALRIRREAFEKELRAAPAAGDFMMRYAQVWCDQLGISAACNAVHSVEARCARWLLMTHDRMYDDVLPLKQEFLAYMLGVRRPSVTIAASALQRAGLISYSRGRITVVNRPGLEAASCECYQDLNKVYNNLLS